MARRRGKKGRGKRSKTIPLLPTVAALYPGLEGVKFWYDNQRGDIVMLPVDLVGAYTGYNMKDKSFQSMVPIRNVAIVLGGVIGHKIANKVGVNKYVKKATMGFFSL